MAEEHDNTKIWQVYSLVQEGDIPESKEEAPIYGSFSDGNLENTDDEQSYQEAVNDIETTQDSIDHDSSDNEDNTNNY